MIKGTDYRKRKRIKLKIKEIEMRPNLTPFIPCRVQYATISSTLTREGVRKYAICNQEKKNRKFHYSIHCSFQSGSNIPIAMAEKDLDGEKEYFGGRGTGDAFKLRYLRKLSGSVRERRAVQL